MQKGQAAVELLIILAVSMVALIAIYGYSSTTMTELNKQQLVDEAQTSVNDLTKAADDVYRQGVGAQKQVFYTVPSGVDASQSGIEQDTFVLNVLNSDVYGKPKVCLLGTMPTGPGGHWVWLTAQEQCVFVGLENIAVDKTSSYVTLGQSDSAQDTIVVTNNGSETATVFMASSWTPTDVTLGISPATFSLASQNSQSVTLTYTSNASASGNYAGSVKVNAAFATAGDENIFVPANAEVVVPSQDLLIFPASHSTTLAGGDSETVDLNVCNNSASALTNIAFLDTGDTAAWIGAISTITSLAAGTCVMTSFTIDVPGGQGFGEYTGTITATDDAANTDTTAVTVTVPSMATNFTVDWSSSRFVSGGKRLWDWTTDNAGSTDVIIDKMTITWTNDTDGATLDEIRINNIDVWSVGGGTSGQEIDITNSTVPASTSYSANNRLDFDEEIDDESEDFQIVFEFTDGSTYTSPLYEP